MTGLFQESKCSDYHQLHILYVQKQLDPALLAIEVQVQVMFWFSMGVFVFLSLCIKVPFLVILSTVKRFEWTRWLRKNKTLIWSWWALCYTHSFWRLPGDRNTDGAWDLTSLSRASGVTSNKMGSTSSVISSVESICLLAIRTCPAPKPKVWSAWSS